jgi:hypothetical protein
MSGKLTKQCSNCFGWYSKLNGLKHHLRHCRRSNDCQTSEEVQRHMAHPMLSLSSISSVFASNRSFQLEDENTHHVGMDQTEDCDFGENRDGNDLTFDNDIGSSFRPLHWKTVAVTKLQVMLNDLLLKHKASLLLYDEIIDLISIYISSPDFNRFNKFKSRKILLQSTQKSLSTSCLRPLNGTVWLHNNSLVTVSVFDA